MSILNDQSAMPFGKYKGAPMEQVPADYLLYLWESFLHNVIAGDNPTPGSLVRDYIVENFSVLETEAKDFIVKHRP